MYNPATVTMKVNSAKAVVMMSIGENAAVEVSCRLISDEG
jgi:hypothetical protein